MIQEHLDAGDSVEVHCERCQAIGPLDLIGMVAFGHGEISLRLYCSECSGQATANREAAGTGRVRRDAPNS